MEERICGSCKHELACVSGEGQDNKWYPADHGRQQKEIMLKLPDSITVQTIHDLPVPDSAAGSGPLGAPPPGPEEP